MTMNGVAAYSNVNRTTINRLKRKTIQTGDVVDLQRSGRPRKTTAAKDRHLRTMHLRDRFKSASETARNWRGHVQIGHKTIIRRLNAHGLRCRRPV